MKAFTLLTMITVAIVCLSTSIKAQSNGGNLVLRNDIIDSVAFKSLIKQLNTSNCDAQVINSGTLIIKRLGYTKTGDDPVALPNSYLKANDSSTPIPTYKIIISQNPRSAPKR